MSDEAARAQRALECIAAGYEEAVSALEPTDALFLRFHRDLRLARLAAQQSPLAIATTQQPRRRSALQR